MNERLNRISIVLQNVWTIYYWFEIIKFVKTSTLLSSIRAGNQTELLLPKVNEFLKVSHKSSYSKIDFFIKIELQVTCCMDGCLSILAGLSWFFYPILPLISNIRKNTYWDSLTLLNTRGGGGKNAFTHIICFITHKPT